MTTNAPLPPAGWYPDPQGGGGHRWWDGTAWTAYTHPAQDAAPVQPAQQPAQPVAPVQPAPPVTPVQPAAPAQPVAPVAPAVYAPAAYTAPGYAAVAEPPIGAWRSAVDDRPRVTGMGSAIRTVFAKYVGFDGRAGRAEFWWWALLNAIIIGGMYIVLIVGGITLSLGSSDQVNGATAIGGLLLGLAYVLLLLWALAVMLPNLAVTVRRLRDAGFPWALVFLELIPFGGIAILVMCAQPSKYP